MFKRKGYSVVAFTDHEHVVDNFNRIHEEMLGVLTDSEKEMLLHLMDKISNRIEGGSKC